MNIYNVCAFGIGALAALCVCIAFHRLTRNPDPPHVVRGGFGRYFRASHAAAAFHAAMGG